MSQWAGGRGRRWDYDWFDEDIPHMTFIRISERLNGYMFKDTRYPTREVLVLPFYLQQLRIYKVNDGFDGALYKMSHV